MKCISLVFFIFKWYLCCLYISFSLKLFFIENFILISELLVFISAQLEEIPLIYETNAVYEARLRALNSYHVQYNSAYNKECWLFFLNQKLFHLVFSFNFPMKCIFILI